MQIQQLGYHRFRNSHSLIRQIIGIGALASLAFLFTAAAGQLTLFGQCFQIFTIPGIGDYCAYGFVIGGHWIFWHDFALAAGVLPIIWLSMRLLRFRRERRYPGATA